MATSQQMNIRHARRFARACIVAGLLGASVCHAAEPVVSGTDPIFSAPPTMFVEVGALLDIVAGLQTSGSTVRYEWRQNGKLILSSSTSQTNNGPGNTYLWNIALPTKPATLESAGAYTLTAGTVGGTGVSTPIEVIVVDTALTRYASGATGKPVVLTAPVAGNGYTCEWTKDSNTLEESAHLKGTKSKVLTLTAMTPDDVGIYKCLVTVGTELKFTGAIDLSLPGVVPSITTTALENAHVARSYEARLQSSPAASSYAVAGLPTGLVYDSVTGIISGRPRAFGTFQLAITGKNAKGASAVKKLPLVVAPLPSYALGSFKGAGGYAQNGGISASLDLTVTGSGAFTGKFQSSRLDGEVFTNTISGTVNEDMEDQTSMGFTTTLPLLPPYFSNPDADRGFTITSDGLVLFANVSKNPTDPSNTWVDANHNDWNARTHPSTAFKGYFTGKIFPGSISNPAMPGYGYTMFTVGTAGTFTFAGKLPDGTAFAIPTFLDEKGNACLNAWLYGNKGRFAGYINFNEISAGSLRFGDNGAYPHSYQLNWNKPPAPGAGSVEGDVPMMQGFVDSPVIVMGEKYAAPNTTAYPYKYMVPIFPDSPQAPDPNTWVTLLGGGLENETNYPGILRTNHTMVFPAIDPKAPPGVQIHSLAFNPATGFFAGTWTHRFVNSTSGKAGSYSGPFQGVVVHYASGERQGWGFFLEPVSFIIPGLDQPVATGLLSGSVTLGALY